MTNCGRRLGECPIGQKIQNKNQKNAKDKIKGKTLILKEEMST